MKKNFLLVVFVVIAIFVLFKYSDYNLNRAVAACMLAQKQTSESFNAEKAKKYCKEEIKKQKNN